MTYDFKCKKCKRVWELYMPSSVQEPTKGRSCPKCNSKRIMRIITAPALKFTGSGFYITDYADK